MASCLVPEFPAVLVALEHLCELDKQLNNERVTFRHEASHHLREISAAITELEESRRSVRERLEVATIETSKLRHRILRLRDDTTVEISAAVAAARESNMAQIDQLQAELKNIVQDTEFMEKKQELIEKQNATLFAERDLVKCTHEDVIDELNYQLSEKANKQILLHETLNEIQGLRGHIASVASAQDDLAVDMVEDRKKFIEKKMDLEKRIEVTVERIEEQKRTNADIRRELDSVSSELQDKEEKVTECNNLIAQLERNIIRLRASEQLRKGQLEEDAGKSEDLSIQKVFLEKELIEVRESFEQKAESFHENISKLDAEMQDALITNRLHQESLIKLSDSFKIQRREEDDVRAVHLHVSQKLKRSKLQLEERISSIAKFKMEIREMEEEMKQLCESSKISAELWQKNLKESEAQLDRERKSRSMFEVEQDELCTTLDTLKGEHLECVREVTKAIEFNKKKYAELLNEEEKLQDHLLMDSLIDDLSEKVVSAQEEYKRMEISYRTEIQELTNEAETIQERQIMKKEELKKEGSLLKDVEAQFIIDQSNYQTLEKVTAELKSKQNQLELSIRELKVSTEALLKPKDELKREIETLRAKHMELLRSQAAAINITERSIYENSMMLEQVNLENSRLHLCIEQMKVDIHHANSETEKSNTAIQSLRKEMQFLLESLQSAWETDTLVTLGSSEREQATLQAFHDLMCKIQERQHQIGDISSKLGKELEGMKSLLKTDKT